MRRGIARTLAGRVVAHRTFPSRTAPRKPRWLAEVSRASRLSAPCGGFDVGPAGIIACYRASVGGSRARQNSGFRSATANLRRPSEPSQSTVRNREVGAAQPTRMRCWTDGWYRLSRRRGLCRRAGRRVGSGRAGAWPAADRAGPAAAGGMGGQCLARSAGDPDRLDFGCGGETARDPAQLGGLCAGSASPRGADPATVAQGLGQAAGLRSTGADGPARLVDAARRRDRAGGAAVHEPVSQRRGAVCRRPHRRRRAAPI